MRPWEIRHAARELRQHGPAFAYASQANLLPTEFETPHAR